MGTQRVMALEKGAGGSGKGSPQKAAAAGPDGDARAPVPTPPFSNRGTGKVSTDGGVMWCGRSQRPSAGLGRPRRRGKAGDGGADSPPQGARTVPGVLGGGGTRPKPQQPPPVVPLRKPCRVPSGFHTKGERGGGGASPAVTLIV